jgi:hypothetical protein
MPAISHRDMEAQSGSVLFVLSVLQVLRGIDNLS